MTGYRKEEPAPVEQRIVAEEEVTANVTIATVERFRTKTSSWVPCTRCRATGQVDSADEPLTEAEWIAHFGNDDDDAFGNDDDDAPAFQANTCRNCRGSGGQSVAVIPPEIIVHEQIPATVVKVERDSEDRIVTVEVRDERPHTRVFWDGVDRVVHWKLTRPTVRLGPSVGPPPWPLDFTRWRLEGGEILVPLLPPPPRDPGAALMTMAIVNLAEVRIVFGLRSVVE